MTEAQLHKYLQEVKRVGFIPKQYESFIAALGNVDPDIFDLPTEDEYYQAQEEERKKQYYTSQEMFNYLQNETNARTSPQYQQLYKEALPYYTGVQKTKIQNAAGDKLTSEEEKTIAEQQKQWKQQIGIGNFESQMAAGMFNSGNFEDRLHDYMNQYELTPEQMSTLIAATPDAQAHATNLASWGKYNSQRKQAERFQKEVTDAMNEAGIGLIKTAMNPLSPVYMGLTWDGKSDLSKHFAYDGSELSDVLKQKTNYEGGKVSDFLIDVAGNPWSWPGLAMLGKSAVSNTGKLYRNGIALNRQNLRYVNNTPKGPRSKGVNVSSTTTPPAKGATIDITSSPHIGNANTTAITTTNGQVINPVVNQQSAAQASKALKPNQWQFGNVPYNKGRMRVKNPQTGKYSYYNRPDYVFAADDVAHAQNYQNLYGKYDGFPDAYILEAYTAPQLHGGLGVAAGSAVIPTGYTSSNEYIPQHPGTYVPSAVQTITVSPYQGSQEFQKAFAAARKSGADTFTFKGKEYGTKLGSGEPITYTGKSAYAIASDNIDPTKVLFATNLGNYGDKPQIKEGQTVSVSGRYKQEVDKKKKYKGTALKHDGGKLNYFNYL